MEKKGYLRKISGTFHSTEKYHRFKVYLGEEIIYYVTLDSVCFGAIAFSVILFWGSSFCLFNVTSEFCKFLH